MVGNTPMKRKDLDQRGAVLLLLLVIVAIMGLATAIAGSSWKTTTQRAKEDDLLWKGGQIRAAIGRYYETAQSGATTVKKYPASLDDLLLDSRFLETVRYLRKVYPDPMTGGRWALIAAPDGGIMGVRSTATQKPFKQSNFSKRNKNFVGKQSYREWEFIYLPAGSRTGTESTGGNSS
jgi:type II secretory pathway pseudopilin PulG